MGSGLADHVWAIDELRESEGRMSEGLDVVKAQIADDFDSPNINERHDCGLSIHGPLLFGRGPTLFRSRVGGV